MAKKYRLLKDTLRSWSTKDFVVLAGELFLEAGDRYIGERSKWYFTKYFVENNPDWFEEIKEKERIRARYMPHTLINSKSGSSFVIKTDQEIQGNQMYSIVEAINRVLNDDSVFDADRINNQIEKLKSMEDAFNAARLTHPFDVMKFDSFNDYLKSIE